VKPARIAAAIAALLTALLLQGTLVAPLTMWVPVSLPAVLVAAVALVDGPTTGMSFGFAVGLVADLGSNHPAGVLALSWLGLGIACGLATDRRTVRADALVTATLCTLAAAFATLLLAAVHSGGVTAWLAFREAVPVGLGDGLLALGVVPVVRAFLHTDRLRALRPLAAAARPGARRG
jgi:cell shape-determining protein MreD